MVIDFRISEIRRGTRKLIWTHIKLIIFLYIFLDDFNILIYKIKKNIILIKNIIHTFGNAIQPAFLKNLKYFFLLKFNMVCTFWIVLMCWCQKWFLKNEKTSFACILARKIIWKAPTITLPNMLSNQMHFKAACSNKTSFKPSV
jgi:hypothetical protein